MRTSVQEALRDLEGTGILNREQTDLLRRIYGLDGEVLTAMQPLAPAPAKTPAAEGFRPGGGGFGGGGASGGY